MWKTPATCSEESLSNGNDLCCFLIMSFSNLKNYCHGDVNLNPRESHFRVSVNFLIVNFFLMLVFFKAVILASDSLRIKSHNRVGLVTSNQARLCAAGTSLFVFGPQRLKHKNFQG